MKGTEPMHKSSNNPRSYFWPLLLIVTGLVILLLALDIFPAPIADLIERAWPALLVIVGIAVGLDQISPLRRWAPLVAVIVVIVLLAGMIFVSYTTRAAAERTDNVVSFSEVLDPGVDRLRVVIDGLENTVEVSPTVGSDEFRIDAAFTGSTESEVAMDYEVIEGVATFTLRETRSNLIPMLEAMGRGRVNVELPPGLPAELDFSNASGTVSLNLLGLQVVRLNVDMARGDLLLSLPNVGLERRGEVVVGGDVTVFVPSDLGLQVSTGGKLPQFAEGNYLLDPSVNAYLSRRFDDFTETTELGLTASGAILLD